MNRSQEKSLHTKARLRTVQRVRKIALWTVAVFVATVLPFVQSTWPDELAIHESIEAAGLVLIGMAVFGRAWCTLYIGGRKAKELVDIGPYSISRNPLYVFTIIGAVGVGAQTGSVVTAIAFGFVTFLVFLPVVLREEQALQSLFWEAFQKYRRRVPRFMPRTSAWRDEDIVATRPGLLWRTVRDSSVFFFVVPVIELIDWLQVTAVVAPVVRLP